jgi:hypothetical protein
MHLVKKNANHGKKLEEQLKNLQFLNMSGLFAKLKELEEKIEINQMIYENLQTTLRTERKKTEILEMTYNIKKKLQRINSKITARTMNYKKTK